MKYLVTYWEWQYGIKVPTAVETFDDDFNEKRGHSYAYANSIDYDGFYATKYEEIIEA